MCYRVILWINSIYYFIGEIEEGQHFLQWEIVTEAINKKTEFISQNRKKKITKQKGQKRWPHQKHTCCTAFSVSTWWGSILLSVVWGPLCDTQTLVVPSWKTVDFYIRTMTWPLVQYLHSTTIDSVTKCHIMQHSTTKMTERQGEKKRKEKKRRNMWEFLGEGNQRQQDRTRT